MEPERWHRLKDVLSLALKRPAAQRAAVLDDACRGDPSLRRDAADLVDCEPRLGGFLEAPLADRGRDAASDMPDEAVPSAFQDWSRYRIDECLGRGGMAVVYKAWDPALRRTVAIKLVSGHDAVTIKRFLHEAEAQAGVEHDNVLKIFETGVVDQHHYIAMQYVNGPTLLGVQATTTIEQKAELMRQIAEGLDAAHRHGLVHRDVKPGNILVEQTAGGLKPYVLDFGLAVEVGAPALTKTGVVVGTPRYMAPERIESGTAALDPRSDIYSLGATFYEFISGRPPFPGSSGLQVLVDVLESEWPPLRALQPAIAPELDAIIGKCLERDPQRRYASARALADDLRHYLDGDGVSARPTGRIGRLVRRARRHPRLAAAYAATGLAVLVLAAWAGYASWRTARQTVLAQQLGEEIRNIEWLYRAAEMSPLHAIEPQKQQVRQQTARLAGIMNEAGAIAYGPGHYALGRAALALREDTRALQHLELSFASGYWTPDLAMALGLAHSAVFRAEIEKAQRIEADAARDARMRELEAAHRDPALRFLAQGRSSAIVPSPYVDALIASLRGDTPAAIDKADAASRETPWLFEARLLPGYLAFKDAVVLYERGQESVAADRAADADRYYAEAERIAPSSVEAYRGRCAVVGLVLHMIGHRLALDPAEPKQRAETACARAVAVEPDTADGYRLYAEALQEWGMQSVQHEADPGDVFDRAARLAERAMELSGGDVETRLALAGIFLNRAWWESRTERDPRPAIAQAVALQDKVLAMDPRNAIAYDNRGQANVLQGHFERLHGIDAVPAQSRAIADFEHELLLDPAMASGYTNLGREAVGRADEYVLRGVDPAPGLAAVLRFIDGLPGDRSMPRRVDAVTRLRARIEKESRAK